MRTVAESDQRNRAAPEAKIANKYDKSLDFEENAFFKDRL
jgi:hypothetical protein